MWETTRTGRLWLRNLYRVHQRLCMAFPSASRKSEDKHFLQPFKPEDFGSSQVHVARGIDAGFLFRIEPRPPGRVAIVVQSAAQPDWDYAFHNAALLAVPWLVKRYEPRFQVGQSLRFRLVANPTRKIDTKTGADGKKNNGQRVPVAAGKLDEWLSRRAETAGFRVEQLTSVQAGYVYFSRPDKEKVKEPGADAANHGAGDGESQAGRDAGHKVRSVRYDGILRVTDPALFCVAVLRGIGPGKAFGFGLLSVAPVGTAP